MRIESIFTNANFIASSFGRIKYPRASDTDYMRPHQHRYDHNYYR